MHILFLSGKVMIEEVLTYIAFISNVLVFVFVVFLFPSSCIRIASINSSVRFWFSFSCFIAPSNLYCYLLITLTSPSRSTSPHSPLVSSIPFNITLFPPPCNVPSRSASSSLKSYITDFVKDLPP